MAADPASGAESTWQVARATLFRDLDAEERRAQPDLARQNLARFTSLVPLLLIAHGVAMVTTAPWAAWGDYRSVTFVIHAVTIALDLCLLAVAVSARRAGTPPAWFGDATVLLYSAFGLAISSNAQRVTASADFLNFALFSTAVLFRARLSAVIVAYLGSAAAFWALLEFLQPLVDTRRTVGSTTTAVALVAFGFSRLLVRSDLREVSHRQLIADQKAELEVSKEELEARKAELEIRQAELERLNEALERKVENQLEEIVQRSQEVEALDAQLRFKVRDRAKDLVKALREGAASRTDTPLVPGMKFAGRIVIRRLLGAGGMGEVYLGEDEATGRAVAVKRMRTDGPTDPSTLERFASEAAAVSAVDHPGVVRCLHVDVTDEGGLFHIMEYVKGSTLQEAARTGQIDLAASLRLGAGIASVLAAAHHAGVVHRDIKPSNVMLTASTPGVRVLDFGISKVHDSPSEATKTGQIIGTPRYMAPEQFQEGSTITGAADVYALGAVVYELIAREPPFAGSSLLALIRAHLEKPAPRLSEKHPEVPPAVTSIVARCLEKDPARRPTAADVVRELEAAAEALGASKTDEIAARLAQAGRLRAAFDFDTVAHELAHAIARPPAAPRPSSAPTVAPVPRPSAPPTRRAR